MDRWNLFSKILLFALFWGCGEAQAIQVQALYTASCQREIGVIVDVNAASISLLSLKGEIVVIPRYEVIYYATYPIDTVPIAEVKNPSLVPLTEIKTYQNGDGLTTLLRGWAVDFNQDKVAFLTLRGAELMIDRSSIWAVHHDEENQALKFTNPPTKRYSFEHPYSFSSCESGTSPSALRIYPQQLFSDPVTIKRELDRLADGHAEIHRYERDQQFYAVPELYPNETSLGLWLMTGSRYGSSSSRANNFTPILVNQYSSGPFGFQSVFLSGAAPILQSIHEESQTQVYYRMKADYFHFSAMVDPNLLLVGSKYDWRAEDMAGTDLRGVESAFLELGFDYGPMALELYPGGVVNIGARDGIFFQQKSSLPLQKVGVRYQGYHWLLHGIFGSGNSNGFKITLMRANVEWARTSSQRYILSLIDRIESFNGSDSASNTQFSVNNQSLTAAAYGYFKFKKRYWAGGMLAVEDLSQSGSVTPTTKTTLFPKVGTTAAISF